MTEPVQDAPHVATVLRLAAAMQRWGFVLAGVAAVVAVVAWSVLRGTPGLVGAGIAAVVGLALGWLGTWVMARTARTSPAGVMIGAMTAFGVKIAFLLVFLLLFRGTALFDNRAFALSLLAVTVLYTIGEVVGFVRTKTPVVDV